MLYFVMNKLVVNICTVAVFFPQFNDHTAMAQRISMHYNDLESLTERSGERISSQSCSCSEKQQYELISGSERCCTAVLPSIGVTFIKIQLLSQDDKSSL